IQDFINSIREIVQTAINHEEENIELLHAKHAEAARQVHNGVAFGLSLSILMGFAFLGLIANGLSRSLQSSVKRLSYGATQINDASNQLSQAGQDLSTSTNQTASNLQETITFLEDVSKMIKFN